MNFHYIKPSGILSQYIRHYWVLETSSQEGEVCERIVPTGNIEMFFHYENSFKINHIDNRTENQPKSFVSGISSSYADVYTQGKSGVFVVTFKPLGACNFFSFPLLEIENSNIDLELIYKREIDEVKEKISIATTLNQRKCIVEAFLFKKFAPVFCNDMLMMNESVSLINRCKGQISSEILSKQFEISTKNLERKFSTFLGKTPKQFIKIVRFQQVLKSFSEINRRNLTQLAFDNGYFDQAHFIKDFKSLTGYTPKDFLSLGPCNADYFIE